MSDSLLQLLVQLQNKSGAIKPAPQALINLKQSIMGIPHDINIPGMSQVMSMINMALGIVQMVKQLGSMSAVGNFTNILGQVGGGNLQQALQSVGVAGIQQAVGNAVSLMAGLSAYTSAGQAQQTPPTTPPTS